MPSSLSAWQALPVQLNGLGVNAPQGLRFLPGDPLTVTCDFNSSEREEATSAGSGSKVSSNGLYLLLSG